MTDLEKLDADVAEKVMGYLTRIKRYPTGPAIIDGAFPVRVEEYSAKIDAAMRVLEIVRERGYVVTIFSDWCDVGKWVVKFTERGGTTYWAEDESLPKAICLAAINTVEKRERL